MCIATFLCIRLYHEELLKAQASNQKLGVGIAVFQGLSNISINGETGNDYTCVWLVLTTITHSRSGFGCDISRRAASFNEFH